MDRHPVQQVSRLWNLHIVDNDGRDKGGVS